jgi:uncharacterized Ntn-hydrolase superfamily protein
LLGALRAAEAKGGDIRGRQSAALLIFGVDPGQVDPLFDLRVEDHAEPLDELARLVTTAHAYHCANEGDALVAAGNNAAASEQYKAAVELVPDSFELAFWQGLVLADSGDSEEAMHLVQAAYQTRPQMRDLVQRLQDAGWVNLNAEALHMLMQEGSREVD